MRGAKAYNELIGLLLSEGDQVVLEWAIGAMLSDGPRNPVVLRGARGTGKTTIMNIVRKILLSPFAGNFAPRVAFLTWDSHEISSVDENTFVFVEANVSDAITDDSIIVNTTGHRVPANKHYVLMKEIDSEVITISGHCIALFHELGEDYFQGSSR